MIHQGITSYNKNEKGFEQLSSQTKVVKINCCIIWHVYQVLHVQWAVK